MSGSKGEAEATSIFFSDAVGSVIGMILLSVWQSDCN